ncbi:MAG: metallopeptidase TldD-related protein, partial [bacterium]
SAADARDDPVLRAMTKELFRSFEKLKNAEAVPLYYMDYEVYDYRTFSLSAVLGSLQTEWEGYDRYLDVDIRVGDHAMDNTHEVKGKNAWIGRASQRQVSIPAGNNEDALRAWIWKETDSAYKAAQERYTKVRMNKAVTAEEDDSSDDFSKEKTAEKFYEREEFPSFDRDEWRARVRRYSAMLKKYPYIYDSGVSFSVEQKDRRFVSSEGASIRTGNVYTTLRYSLTTRTGDGMDLQRSNSYHGNAVRDMPSDEKVLADIDKSVRELAALKDAPLAEPYTGPAILRNRASGVFFHEIFGHRMEGHRQKSESEGQTFAKKVGEKILSDFISVLDDPAMERKDGTFLRGYYKYDDEGVRARRVSLVENGVLRTFLMSRSPARGFLVSNGHGRRSPGLPVVARQGNLIIESQKKVPFDELRKQLIAEVKKQKKPYGLIFEDISGGFTNTGRSGVQSFKVLPLLVYRVYTDGRPDEAVRGVDLVGTPLASFSKIIGAGDDDDVFNGTCGAESGWVPVSAVSPSILVSEIEVEKVSKSQNKPPVLPPPYHDKP